MSAEQNIVAFRRLIDEGFSGGSLDVVDEVVDPYCITHQRGHGQGATGVKESISTLHRWFADFRLEIEALVAQDDYVWARSVSSGTHTGRMMGHQPTGKRIGVYVFDCCRFENGRIVEHWGVPDQLGVLQQIGAVPGPPVRPSAPAAEEPTASIGFAG